MTTYTQLASGNWRVQVRRKTRSLGDSITLLDLRSPVIDAVKIFGGDGYTMNCPVERMIRDTKLTRIFEGTNQIQRVVIARELHR